MEALREMKLKTLLMLVAATALAVSASAQQDPDDAGAADSLILSFAHLPNLAAGDSSLVVETYALNDYTLASMSVGLRWNTGAMVMDSAKMTQAAIDAFDMMRIVYYKNNRDSTNAYRYFHCTTLVGMLGTGLLPGRTHMATYWFSIEAATDSIVIDTARAVTAFKFVQYPSVPEFTPRFSGRLVHQFPLSVSVIGDGSLPTRFELAQNYPNPFNPDTRVQFDIPERTHVTLAVFNVLGQRVATLVDEELGPNRYEKTWNGTSDAGAQVASGIYFYKLTAGDKVETKKMMLLK